MTANAALPPLSPVGRQQTGSSHSAAEKAELWRMINGWR